MLVEIKVGWNNCLYYTDAILSSKTEYLIDKKLDWCLSIKPELSSACKII